MKKAGNTSSLYASFVFTFVAKYDLYKVLLYFHSSVLYSL